ncbi:hypothetical protein SK128_013793 [Halocaridina rubra]|uniref:Uncharacterized protein n=1 Tax=Halocaridina rubra TaxID=373956 RepID=A0AAN8XMK5_HALRR
MPTNKPYVLPPPGRSPSVILHLTTNMWKFTISKSRRQDVRELASLSQRSVLMLSLVLVSFRTTDARRPKYREKPVIQVLLATDLIVGHIQERDADGEQGP